MCIDKKIDPVVISTGGYLLKAAQENNNSYIKYQLDISLEQRLVSHYHLLC